MNSLVLAAQFVSQAFAPFGRALAGSDGLLLEYFRKLGWTLPAIPPSLANLRSASNDWLTAFARLEVVLRAQLDGEVAEDQLARAATDFAAALAHLVQAIRALPVGLRAELPQAFIDGSQLAEELVERLFNDALYRKIERESRAALEVLRALGIAEATHLPADAAKFQPAFEKKTLRWDRLQGWASDPAAVLRELYGWGTPQLDASKLFLALRDLAFAAQIAAYFDRASVPLMRAVVAGLPNNPIPQPGLVVPLLANTEQELVLGCYATPTITPAEAQGLMLTLASRSALGLSFELAPALTLKLDGHIDLAAGVALAMSPGQPLRLIGNTSGPAPVAITDASATVALRYAPDDRLTLLNVDGLSLQAKGLDIEAGFGAAAGQPTDVHLQAVLPGLKLDLNGLGQDSFLASILPDNASLETDLGFGWSALRGLYWAGGGPKITLPMSKTLGPVKLSALSIQFTSSGNNAFGLQVGVSAAAKIGPATVVVEGVGAGLTFDTDGGNLGPVDLGASFVPPAGIGLSIDARGIVSGGGFLYRDADQGLYAGAMQLSLRDEITLKAFGLVSTRLPDGSRGYSLIVFITAEDFRPIPLGLGFTLLGIGGMVGVNRTFDENVLRAGMKSGTLATLLFPRDPVGNAPALIRNLASAFPAYRGSYLLGLLAKIGWFTPTLITMDLALIVEFGARQRLLAFGRISALLPSADNDLVRLNLEALGVIDFDAGTATLDAELVESRLAHKFPITGSAALRAGFAEGPSFVLMVGGCNPHFAAPVTVPALNRVTIALSSGDNPRLVCQAYFAITSNTVQFGADASLYARAAGFSVEGNVGFDVLVQLAPLHFIADFHAKLQLKRGSHNLFGVKLNGSLEGPRPLRVSGKATFEILWCDFSVSFDTTLVKGEKPPLPAAVNVLAQLTQALASPTSWSTERSATQTHGVALRSLPPSTPTGPIVLDPLGQVMVKQRVVPLNTARDIDLFGSAPVAGDRRFIVSAALGGTPLPSAPLREDFAPAQFFAMSDDEKLTAPSFESMEAGCVFGDARTSFDPAQIIPAPLEYEYVPITLDGVVSTAPSSAAPAPYTLDVTQLQRFAKSGAAARAPLRRVGRARFRNDSVAAAARFTEPQWSIVQNDDGPAATVAAGARTFSEYQAVVKQLNRGGARFSLVPTHEIDE